MEYGAPKTTKEKIGKTLADKLTAIACRQYDTAERFQKPAFDEALKNEEMLYNKEKPALKGRSNIPFDSIMLNGFVDTTLSKTDEAVNIAFKNQAEEGMKAAMKITEMWRSESAPDKEAWDMKSIDSKRQALIFGSSFFKFYVESDPEFRTCLDVVDGYDMLTEPQGGAWLDKHIFKGQRNIFRTASQMTSRANAGIYDRAQVATLVRTYSEDQFKKNLDQYRFKENRMSALGYSMDTENFVGENLYAFCEWVMEHEGQWYYLVFSKEAKTWVRCEYLSSVFKHAEKCKGRGPWVAWHASRDPFIFWCRAPLSDVRPVAYTMKKVVNLSIDNLEKRNWNMKAYDPEVFPDPNQLLYRQDGLARAVVPAGKAIASGIYEFNVPDTTTITVNLVEFLNGFVGQKTGITPDSQGQSSTDKVGIYYGNIQQVADRIGLQNKMYEQAYTDLGTMFKYGCQEHLREPYAVKLLGLKGVEWDQEVTRDDFDFDFRIIITGGNDADKGDAEENLRKKEALDSIENNPVISKRINPNWYIRERLTMAGWDEADVQQALDTQNDADAELMSEAAQAILDVISGYEPRMNRGANTAWAQKILNYIYDHEITPEQFMILKNYVDAHLQIIRENMIRKARSAAAQEGVDPRMLSAQGIQQPQMLGGRQIPPEQVPSPLPTNEMQVEQPVQ